MREYEVQIGGVPHTLQLDDEDAKRYPGAKPVTKAAAETKQASAPANKARTAKTK